MTGPIHGYFLRLRPATCDPPTAWVKSSTSMCAATATSNSLRTTAYDVEHVDGVTCPACLRFIAEKRAALVEARLGGIMARLLMLDRDPDGEGGA